MRTILSLVAVAALAGVPVTAVVAADMAADATAAAAAVPSVNATILQKLVQLASPLADAANKAESTAATAASIPFTGAMAKDALAKAKLEAVDANGLLGSLKGLLAGKAPASTSLMSQIAAGKASLTDRLSGLPGADILQQVLSTPGLAAALMQQLPVDKVPGYQAVSAMLANVGK